MTTLSVTAAVTARGDGGVPADHRVGSESRIFLSYSRRDAGYQADTLYRPYVERQQREWEIVQRDSRVWIPASLDYAAVPGLSNEMVERLSAARPETLDQVARVPGVTPAALSAVFVAVSRRAAA